MIVRISSEGQYNLPGSFIDELNEIDNELVEAVEAEDQAAFETLLKRMLDLVRDNGTPVPVEELVESDLILPEPDLTLLEASSWGRACCRGRGRWSDPERFNSVSTSDGGSQMKDVLGIGALLTF